MQTVPPFRPGTFVIRLTCPQSIDRASYVFHPG
jgi:hypothetical protein